MSASGINKDKGLNTHLNESTAAVGVTIKQIIQAGQRLIERSSTKGL